MPDERPKVEIIDNGFDSLSYTLKVSFPDGAWEQEYGCENDVKEAAEEWRNRLRNLRDSAMREAAGLVCEQCKDNFFWSPARKRGDAWLHSCLDIPGVAPCHAGPIHERLALKEKG